MNNYFKKALISIYFLSLFINGFSQEERPPSCYFLGLKFMQHQQYDSALNYNLKCIEADSKNLEYNIALARTYYHLSEFEKSKKILVKINSLKSDFADIDLVKCYTLENNFDSAFYYMEKHLGSKYKENMSALKLDPIIGKLNKSSNWNALWSKEWYSKYELELADAEYNISKNNYSLAFDLLDQIIQKRKNAHKAYYLHSILGLSTNDLHLALNDIDNAINSKGNIDLYYFQRSKILFQLKRYKASLSDIKKAIELNPYTLEYYSLEAHILRSNQQYSTALEVYNYYIQFIDISPDNYYWLSLTYLDNNDKINSLKKINKALELNSNNKDYYIARGKIYLSSNMYSFAEKDFTMALDFDYQNAEVYYLRGICRHQQGESEGACRDWFKARNLNDVNSEEYLRKYCVNKN